MRKHFNAPVDLRPAFVWVCHDCGEDSYSRPDTIIWESNEERAIAAEQLGVDLDGLDTAVSGIPETVACQHCKAEFEAHLDAYDPREEEL